MAKQKTKNIPFDNNATEVRPDYWEWMLGGLKWFWENGRGLNFGIVHDDGRLQPVAYIGKLDGAGYFAEGFTAGRDVGKQVTA